MGTITSSRTRMHPAAKLLSSKNGWHSMTSVHCAQSPDLKPTDNFWADIKPDLSRNTQRNVLEFEITIHDILNQIPTKSFLQLVQSMISRIQNCLNTRDRYARYYVVIRNIVMQCCHKLSCLYVCCWFMLFREMLHTISILSQCYKPRIFFLTNNCSSENTYNVW